MLGPCDSVYNMVPFPGGFTDTGPQQWNGTKRMNMCETSTGDPTNTCEVELSGGGGDAVLLYGARVSEIQ